MLREFETVASVAVVRVDISVASGYAAFVSASWRYREKSLASQNRLGKRVLEE